MVTKWTFVAGISDRTTHVRSRTKCKINQNQALIKVEGWSSRPTGHDRDSLVRDEIPVVRPANVHCAGREGGSSESLMKSLTVAEVWDSGAETLTAADTKHDKSTHIRILLAVVVHSVPTSSFTIFISITVNTLPVESLPLVSWMSRFKTFQL